MFQLSNKFVIKPINLQYCCWIKQASQAPMSTVCVLSQRRTGWDSWKEAFQCALCKWQCHFIFHFLLNFISPFHFILRSSTVHNNDKHGYLGQLCLHLLPLLPLLQSDAIVQFQVWHQIFIQLLQRLWFQKDWDRVQEEAQESNPGEWLNGKIPTITQSLMQVFPEKDKRTLQT